MRLNGMLKPSNPLTKNLVDNPVDNAEFYEVDPEWLSPFENSDINIAALELNVTGDVELI